MARGIPGSHAGLAIRSHHSGSRCLLVLLHFSIELLQDIKRLLVLARVSDQAWNFPDHAQLVHVQVRLVLLCPAIASASVLSIKGICPEFTHHQRLAVFALPL